MRGTDLSLTFVRVLSESRCPINPQIQCVWEGTASLQFRIRDAEGTREVQLETHDRANRLSVDEYLVRVMELTPAPRTEAVTPSDRYRVTLRVTRTG